MRSVWCASNTRAWLLWISALLASVQLMASADETVTAAASAAVPRYDVLISGGTVDDGSGHAPCIGEVAIRGDRIVYVGAHAPGTGRERVDAHGKAIAPGFINMLAHPEASLLVDARALSDLRQCHRCG
jgi:N-acyl-D-amino-acid deacylase